ncbi:MAG TPA: hypothetical protein VF748_10230 [Candidatus Acidoferrum sp.]
MLPLQPVVQYYANVGGRPHHAMVTVALTVTAVGREWEHVLV